MSTSEVIIKELIRTGTYKGMLHTSLISTLELLITRRLIRDNLAPAIAAALKETYSRTSETLFFTTTCDGKVYDETPHLFFYLKKNLPVDSPLTKFFAELLLCEAAEAAHGYIGEAYKMVVMNKATVLFKEWNHHVEWYKLFGNLQESLGLPSMSGTDELFPERLCLLDPGEGEHVLETLVIDQHN